MCDGWRQVQLGDLARTVTPNGVAATGQRYVGLEHMDPGDPMIRRWADTDSVSSASTPFEVGDVLFGKLRPYLQKVAVADFVGRCTNEALVYRSTSDELDQGYLALVLRSDAAIAHAVASSAGSRMPRTSIRLMSSFEFGLPPLVEQQRIVDLIGAFDDVMAASPIVEARGTYQQLLSSYVYGPWAKEQLRSALRLRADSERVVFSSSYRVLGVLRSGEGFIDRGDVAGDKTNYGRLMRVHANQLVYRKLTAWEGPISVAGSDEEGGYVSQEFPVFEVLPERLLPGLLRHLCRSPWLWKEMENRLVGSVQRRKRLNPEAFLSVEVPMPPVAEQEELCAGLDAALEVVAGYEAYRDRLSLVRASALELLLSGAHEIPRSYDELVEEVA